MKVNIYFASFIDVIEFEDFLGENIEDYQKSFEEWYYETETMSYGTICKQRSDLKYKVFDVNVIIDWINFKSPNANVKILKRNIMPGNEDKNLPSMHF